MVSGMTDSGKQDESRDSADSSADTSLVGNAGERVTEEASRARRPSGRREEGSGIVQRRSRATSLVSKYGLLIAFALVVIVFTALRPATFPTAADVKSILTTAAPPMILAVALTIVLVMRDFDLSIGSVVGLASAISVVGIVDHGWTVGLAIGLALSAGAVIGVTNGFLVAYLRGSSFIITLAMGSVVTGIEFAISHQNTIYSGLPSQFTVIGQGSLLGLSNLIWIALVVVIVCYIFLERTETGRYMYAIGGNMEAARLAGVHTQRLRLLGFVLVGLGAAATGVLISSQGASYTPDSGSAYLLPAFAAAYLGTAVFRPGEFTVGGTVVGVLFLGVVQTGLTLLNLPTWAINLIQGGILIIAVLVARFERTGMLAFNFRRRRAITSGGPPTPASVGLGRKTHG